MPTRCGISTRTNSSKETASPPASCSTPSNSGKLLNSIEYQVTQGENEYVVSLSLEEYWKYLEYGVSGKDNTSSPFKNPGWGAYPHILNWINVKPVLPRPDKNGKLPSQKSLAITRSIVQNGTQPGGELKDTLHHPEHRAERNAAGR